MDRKGKGGGSDSYREAAVGECYKQRPDEVHYIRTKHNGEFDRRGVDFVVRILLYPFSIEFQVLSSGTSQTVGAIVENGEVIFPSEEIDESIVKSMRRKAQIQHKKHPHIQCILFVGGWIKKDEGETRKKRKGEVLHDIWVETERIFEIVRMRTAEL